MGKWTNVAVTFTVELDRDVCDNAPWLDLTHSMELPAEVQADIYRVLPSDGQPLVGGVELDFDVRSSGSYEPMSMYGGPDHLGWPEEGCDDRELRGVDVLLNGKKVGSLNKDAVDALDDLYREKFEAAELPETDDGPDYDPPDYDDFEDARDYQDVD